MSRSADVSGDSRGETAFIFRVVRPDASLMCILI